MCSGLVRFIIWLKLIWIIFSTELCYFLFYTILFFWYLFSYCYLGILYFQRSLQQYFSTICFSTMWLCCSFIRKWEFKSPALESGGPCNCSEQYLYMGSGTMWLLTLSHNRNTCPLRMCTLEKVRIELWEIRCCGWKSINLEKGIREVSLVNAPLAIRPL